MMKLLLCLLLATPIVAQDLEVEVARLLAGEALRPVPVTRLVNGALSELGAKPLAASAPAEQAYAALAREVRPGQESRAIQGMLNVLDDPHAAWLAPLGYAELEEQIQTAEFGGIGIYVQIDPELVPLVFEAIEGTPAERAGLQAGDLVVAVDGLSTRGWSLDKVQSRLRGKLGSSVSLTIRRGSETFDVLLQRESLKIQWVTSKMLGRGAGYLKIRALSSDTVTELDRVLRELEVSGATAIILDLRNCGAGSVHTVIEVASRFIPDGTEIFGSLTRAHTHYSQSCEKGSGSEKPLVVLVNRYTAGESELLASVLQEKRPARVVGQKTFGLQTFARLYPMPDGAALKITIGRYLHSDGRELGPVQPDILTDGDALEKALELLAR